MTSTTGILALFEDAREVQRDLTGEHRRDGVPDLASDIDLGSFKMKVSGKL